MDPHTRGRAIEQVTSRLKYPQLLALAAALLLVDLVVPDLIPFLDEIFLALLTAIFAFWREAVPAADALAKPPEMDVTPRRRITG